MSGLTSRLVMVLIAIVGTVAVIWFAVAQAAGGGGTGVAGEGPVGAEPLPSESVPARPACPEPDGAAVAAAAADGGPLAGVTLPCLGSPGQGSIDVGAVLHGAPAVLNFWSYSCGPCREEMPVLAEWAESNPGVTVALIHQALSAGRGAAFLQDVGVDRFSFQDTDDIAGPALGLPRVQPITVILDATGQVRAVLPRVFHTTAELDAAVAGALR